MLKLKYARKIVSLVVLCSQIQCIVLYEVVGTGSDSADKKAETMGEEEQPCGSAACFALYSAHSPNNNYLTDLIVSAKTLPSICNQTATVE